MMKNVILFVVLLFCMSVSGLSKAARCYVSTDGQTSANGLSWASSTTLHKALVTPSCTAIWMKAGVYYPVTPVDLANVTQQERDQHFLIDRPLHLFGGFVGTETQMSQRVLSTDTRTILSGDIDRNDTNTDGNHVNETWEHIQGSNSHNVLRLHQVSGSSVSFTSSSAVLNGFTVTGASSQSGMLLIGEGASGTQLAPQLEHIIISGNQGGSSIAVSSTLIGAAGGLTLFIDTTNQVASGARLLHTEVIGNQNGGLKFDAYRESPAQAIELHSCTVAHNKSAPALDADVPVFINQSTFDNNHSLNRAVAVLAHAKLTIVDSLFMNHPQLLSIDERNYQSTIDHRGFDTQKTLSILRSEFKNNGAFITIQTRNRHDLPAVISQTNIHHNGGVGFLNRKGKASISQSAFHHNEGPAIVAGSIGLVGLTFDTNEIDIRASTITKNKPLNLVDLVLRQSRLFGSGVDATEGTKVRITETSIWADRVINMSTTDLITFRNSLVDQCSKRLFTNFPGFGDLGGNAYQEGSAATCGKGAASEITLIDPVISAIDDFGGPTPVLMPAAGSPLVDVTTCSDGSKDQRGVARPQGSQCDIGSVERRFGAKTLTVTIAPDSIGKGNVSAQPSTTSSTGTIENCTNQCSAQYDDESIASQITLVANPTPPNKTFWSGDCVVAGTRNQAVVSIDKPTMQCTVTFKVVDNPVDPAQGLVFQNGFE